MAFMISRTAEPYSVIASVTRACIASSGFANSLRRDRRFNKTKVLFRRRRV